VLSAFWTPKRYIVALLFAKLGDVSGRAGHSGNRGVGHLSHCVFVADGRIDSVLSQVC
jgi:hypothetical protein